MIQAYLRQDYLKEKLQKVIKSKCFKCTRLQYCYKPNEKMDLEELEVFDVYEIDSCKRFKWINYNILTIVFVILFITIQNNQIQALTINNLEFPTVNMPYYNSNDGFIVIRKDDNYYLINCSYYGITGQGGLKVLSDTNGYYFRHSNVVSNTRTFFINTTNNSYDSTGTLYFTTLDDAVSSVILTTHNLLNNLSTIKKNIDMYPTYRFTHNDKIQIINKSNTIMKENFNFTTNKATKGNVLITTETGKFIEQIDFDIVNGTNFNIKVPADNKPYNIYFNNQIGYQDTIFSFDNFESPYFSIKKFEPKYEIIGQLVYQINTIDDRTQFPYIMPTMTKAALLYKELQSDGTFKTVPIVLEKNQKYTFNTYQSDSELIFQFLHPQGSSIQVESNFQIRTSTNEINPLPKEVIDLLLEEVYGSDMPLQPTTQDTIVMATPHQSVKINRLGLSNDLISKMIDLFIETSVGTTGKVEWFGKEINWTENGDEPIKKLKQRNITDTMDNKSKMLSIGQYEYVVFTADSGSIKINIPAQYKINENFTIDILKNYVVPTELEDEFLINNSTIPDLGSTNDIYTRDYNPNMYDWVQGQTGSSGDLTIPNISNIGEQITSFTDMFMIPVKNLFTAMPEIYSLIIFAFGVSIVMFVLGR